EDGIRDKLVTGVQTCALPISGLKAEAVKPARPGALVLAADTVVLLGDRILGKPRDAADALEMLSALNGRTHEVATGVALSRDGKIGRASCRERVERLGGGG